MKYRKCINCKQEIKISFEDPLAICCLNCDCAAALNRAALYKECGVDVADNAAVDELCKNLCSCNILHLMEGSK